MPHVGNKTGARGGQLKNRNSRKHGCYAAILDGRTREAKVMREIEAELVTALGGDPSPQELLIVQRIAFKALRVAKAEAALMGLNGDAPQRLVDDYLKWARELREDLKAVGLQRRAKPVQDLKDYLEERHGK